MHRLESGRLSTVEKHRLIPDIESQPLQHGLRYSTTCGTLIRSEALKTKLNNDILDHPTTCGVLVRFQISITNLGNDTLKTSDNPSFQHPPDFASTSTAK
jgi:hypothetical protein